MHMIYTMNNATLPYDKADTPVEKNESQQVFPKQSHLNLKIKKKLKSHL